MYVCMCVCVCETDRQKDRQTVSNDARVVCTPSCR